MNLKYLSKNTDASPLVIFRILFGLMMFFSIIRFWSYGWIEKLYIEPTFFFSYYGFEWVKPFGNFTYLIFIICAISSLFITIGYKYRIAIIVFFLSFTYIELMDKTTYLNHYYFVSTLSFLLIFLPANAHFSLDAYFRKKEYLHIPKWNIDSIKLLLGIVYVYAGLAKLNSDWLFRAQPLKIWLPSKYDLPLIGETFMQQEWFHYLMSWGGAVYDLTIPFLLIYKRTRIVAFLLVLFFHIFTKVLFSIGMFPYIMIVSSLIFFDAGFHRKIIAFIQRFLGITPLSKEIVNHYEYSPFSKKILKSILIPFFIIQLLLPWRYLLYPGELFWTEEGYRFSWRVMLIEKAGNTNFKIVDEKTKKYFYVDNTDFLTAFQEKQMGFQPDFILEYAHYLGDHFSSQGHQNVQVFVDSYVTLNGRLSEPFIDPQVDLYQQKESFRHKKWILPFNSTIKIKGI
ncbi:MAG: Uncharacterised protein [Flavobacterium sp. SCGC AAA160-P02]|nr:MAG: Uncharacterised protein [Flavobacterium sp. SCGC AAA160-P02]